MKKLLKKIIIIIISVDFIYKIFNKLMNYGWMVKFQRELLDREKLEIQQINNINSIFEKPVVLNGPFKDMKYPKYRSRSSSLYSKLIGSYEMEITDYILTAIDDKYQQVIDIGCAEGYYAVGLALKIEKTTVYAYDIDSEARKLTTEMANINDVSKKVVVRKSIKSSSFSEFDLTKKTLIISDIEGAERFIFNSSNIKLFKNCFLIIETHDWVDINISTDLENLFSPTHNVKAIQSIGDNIKAKNYSFTELESLDLLTKYRVFEEGRRYVDEWLIISPN
jgi:hypothetical protein